MGACTFLPKRQNAENTIWQKVNWPLRQLAEKTIYQKDKIELVNFSVVKNFSFVERFTDIWQCFDDLTKNEPLQIWKTGIATNCNHDKLSFQQIVGLANCWFGKLLFWQTVVLANCWLDKELVRQIVVSTKPPGTKRGSRFLPPFKGKEIFFQQRHKIYKR